jgi:hypothetical protein
MDSYPPRLDDPQFAPNWPPFEYMEEAPQAIQQGIGRCPRSELENDDPGRLVRGEPQHLAEVVVEGDQHPSLIAADGEQRLVGRTAHAFVVDRRDVVPGGAQQLGTTAAEVLVELEFHAARSCGTGMMRSRAASAP